MNKQESYEEEFTLNKQESKKEEFKEKHIYIEPKSMWFIK